MRRSVTFENIREKALETATDVGSAIWKGIIFPGGKNWWINLKENWRAAMTVGLVNIPFSLSLSVQSGGSPMQGILCAIWTGFFCSLLGGCPYNIVGLTPAIAGMQAPLVMLYGASMLPVLAIGNSLFCIAAFVFGLNRYFLVSESVADGFMLANALSLGLGQVPWLFSLPRGSSGSAHFIINFYNAVLKIPQAEWFGLGWGVINIFALYFLATRIPKIPWSLVFSGIGAGVGYLSVEGYLGPIRLVVLGDRFQLDFNLWEFPLDGIMAVKDCAPDCLWDLFNASFGMALIVIMEDLVTMRVADRISGDISKPRQELAALGIANLVGGLAGAPSGSAAVARTLLNLKTGATSRVSGILNCLICVGLSAVMFPVFRYLPMPTVGALMVLIALRFPISTKKFMNMAKNHPLDFSVSIITAILAFLFNNVIGLLFGWLSSLLAMGDRLSHGYYRIHVATSENPPELHHPPPTKTNENDDVVIETELDEHLGTVSVIYQPAGQISYVNASVHGIRLNEAVKRNQKAGYDLVVTLDLEQVYYVDFDAVDRLEDIVKNLQQKKIIFSIQNVQRKVLFALQTQKWFQELLDSGIATRLPFNPEEETNSTTTATPVEDIPLEEPLTSSQNENE